MIVSEDVEENVLVVNITAGGRLEDDDLLSFVNYPHLTNDFTSINLKNSNITSTNQEFNRNGARVTWVESTQSGELIPIARRILMGADELGSNDLDGQNGDLEDGGVTALIDAQDGEFESSLLIMKGPQSLHSNSIEQRCEVDEVVANISAYNNLVMLQRGVFLIFQGIFAGFVFVTLYLRQASAGDDSKLLLYYQPSAQEFRRYFYLLSTIAVVGSMDSLFTIIKSREEARTSTVGGHLQSSNYHRTLTLMKINYDAFSLALVFVTSFLYCVAFLCTLLMTAQDVLISNRNGYPLPAGSSSSSSSTGSVDSYDDEWISAALADSSFRAGLTEWKGLERARLVCAVMAWLGCCTFVWNGLTQLNSKSADLFRYVVNTLPAARFHLSLLVSDWVKLRPHGDSEVLEGEGGLERLGAAELKRLVQKQRVGMDRVTATLNHIESTTAIK